jgi:hypothetical protein
MGHQAKNTDMPFLVPLTDAIFAGNLILFLRQSVDMQWLPISRDQRIHDSENAHVHIRSRFIVM